jgi:iron complex outermembrane receptor protein
MNPLRTALALACGLVVPLAAQVRIDTLPPIAVSLTRTPQPVDRLGLPITSTSGESARRGRPFASFADLFGFVPGVFATDRGDPTVDQRITIRGSGARSNFGLRGIRVLVDGVPATLPDGQTQLGALIPSTITRIDVARGPLGALHGNDAGGVVAVTTADRPTSPSAVTATLAVTSPDQLAARVSLGGAAAHLNGLVSSEWTETDGRRRHARTTTRRFQGALTWRPADRSTFTLRASLQDDPFNQAPGALTLAEFSADPTAAAPRNVALDAGKAVRQWQVAVGWRGQTGRVDLDVHAWRLGRELGNPIAAPAPTDPRAGTWIDLDRRVSGARSSAHVALRPRLDLSVGIDWQRMHDGRQNRPHLGSGPLGAPFVDQVETVTELGPFAQAVWQATAALSLRGGVRHDRIAFTVNDALDPAASGRRVMSATTPSASISFRRGGSVAWLGVAQAFDTPTTTELANRADGGTGLNRTLGPARTTTLEVGVRRQRTRFRIEAAAWSGHTADAILPAAEVAGRSVYHNVTRTTSRGIEAAADVVTGNHLWLRGVVTVIDARFGPGTRAGDGRSLSRLPIPGVPRWSGRLGAALVAGTWRLDLDQEFRSGTPADDDGSHRADGWGPGVTGAVMRWFAAPGLTLTLTGTNLTDRPVVASVVVDAAGGRFIQPLARRAVQIGAELAF